MSHILLLYIQGEVNFPSHGLVTSHAQRDFPSRHLFTSYHGYQVLYYDDQYHGAHANHGTTSGDDYLHLKEDANASGEITTATIPSSSSPDDEIFKCLMLGIPIEMPQEELSSFLEPYLGDIISILLFRDIHLEGCQSAIIQFVEQDSMDSFCRLYSNLHFPSHSTAAPCIVLPLEECILSVDTSSYATHSSSPLDVTIEASNIFPSTTHFPSSPPSILTLPAVERGISSESHHSNGPYERANWSSSLLSPPPPSYLQLPNCPICLRRIVSRLSHINEETLDERDRLIIGPSFIGHGDRCLVCHIYSDTSSTLRICNVCGLRENVWTCLQCGYTGCGRYTSQHAKKHFHDKGHPFSLELATGRYAGERCSLFSSLSSTPTHCFPNDHRIWDYVHDTFVHIDPLSEFSPQSLPISRPPFNEPSAFEKPYPIYPLSESMNTLLPTAPTSQHEEFLKKFHPPHEDSMTLFHSTESESANEKMRYLQQEYEDLLVSQLTDQRLYYEKLIAQSTVHLLESGHHIPSSAVDRFVETRDHHHARTTLGSPAPAQYDSAQWAEHADQELETIQNIKLDISGLEYEYSLTLQKIRSAEMKALELRKVNDKLVAKQKIQRQRITDFTERAEELKKREEEKIESLEQEIKDLEFFIRARHQINSSGLGDEVRSGIMVVQQGTSSRSRGTKHRKKKGGR